MPNGNSSTVMSAADDSSDEFGEVLLVRQSLVEWFTRHGLAMKDLRRCCVGKSPRQIISIIRGRAQESKTRAGPS